MGFNIRLKSPEERISNQENRLTENFTTEVERKENENFKTEFKMKSIIQSSGFCYSLMHECSWNHCSAPRLSAW